MYYKRLNRQDYHFINSPIALQASYDNLMNEKGVIISSDEKGEFILVPSNMVDEFVVTAVSRQDISSRGFNADELTDEQMEELASNLEESYIEYGNYWDCLESECEEMGVTKDESLIDNENEEED